MKMDLKGGREGMEWMRRVGQMVCCCEHGNKQPVSHNAGDFLSSSGSVSFSRRTLFHGVS